MININVFSDEKAWSKKVRRKEIFFKKVCEAFPKKYKFINREVSLSLMLSNNKTIRKLNKKFRNKNKPTDILSFPFYKNINKGKKIYIGDIIISYNYINKSKKQKDNLFKDKLIKTFIHGFLHLLNYDHKKDKDYFEMFKEENIIYKSVISKINLN